MDAFFASVELLRYPEPWAMRRCWWTRTYQPTIAPDGSKNLLAYATTSDAA